jgi:hydroxyethylthiazole kinase-like uncharacterized protein yjeF
MYIVTAEEMRKLDRYVIDVIGISAVVLMENAGREVANQVGVFCDRSSTLKTTKSRDGQLKVTGRQRNKRHWLILVGKGNNGGDGLVAARYLIEAGFEVTLVLAEVLAEVTDAASKTDAALQLEIAVRLGIPMLVYPLQSIDWGSYEGIVDGLLGTGSKGAPREPYAGLIREANRSGLPIISIDIPSGLNADTGEVYEPCIQAAHTVALAFLKCGLVLYPGAESAGEITVRSIGIPVRSAAEQGVQTLLLQETLFKERLDLDVELPRKADSNKGTYGHVLVAAGTRQMSGAGLLSSHAALRTGCGLVTWALPNRLVETMIGKLPEIMLRGITDGEQGDWSQASSEELIQWADKKAAMVIGPGMGRFPEDSAWLRVIWEGTSCALVVDADALNMIADATDFASWKGRSAAVILTPHPGEMARMLGISVHEVQRNRIGLARRYAVQHGVTLVLKGTRTVCATPAGVVYVNTTGNPGMATAGAGDVLAGMLGSLLAQGLTAEQAACLGVYLHGAAGDHAAAKRHSAGSLMASDIIEAL